MSARVSRPEKREDHRRPLSVCGIEELTPGWPWAPWGLEVAVVHDRVCHQNVILLNEQCYVHRTARLPRRFVGIEAASKADPVTVPPFLLFRGRKTMRRRRRRSGEGLQRTTAAAINTRLLHLLQSVILPSSSKVRNRYLIFEPTILV